MEIYSERRKKHQMKVFLIREIQTKGFYFSLPPLSLHKNSVAQNKLLKEKESHVSM